MKITELLESAEQSKPIVYVDMDGVLADLYSHAAEISDVEHYNQMTPKQWETFLRGNHWWLRQVNAPGISAYFNLYTRSIKATVRAPDSDVRS